MYTSIRTADLRSLHILKTMTTANTIISKSTSWQMFDDISPRYDFLNHLLSFGLDIRWRRRLARFLKSRPGQNVLDLATGTADVLISLFKNNPHVQKASGIDLAEKMLAIGRPKIIREGLQERAILKHGDAHNIPFDSLTFDAVTIAFGIRNMENPEQVLKEMRRVLKKGGRALVLEFSLPQNVFIRWVHLAYLRHIVPLIGAAFSGHYRAYKYLNQTIESFPYGTAFCALMAKAGFQHVQACPLMSGIATIYQGDKI